MSRRSRRPSQLRPTITSLARYLRRCVGDVKKLARSAGVRLRRRDRLVRHSGRDFRPRRTARREYQPLSRRQAKAILAAYYQSIGLRFLRSQGLDTRDLQTRGAERPYAAMEQWLEVGPALSPPARRKF